MNPIRSARHAHGWTLAELARKACIPLPTLAKYETWARRPPEHAVERIADALGVDRLEMAIGLGVFPTEVMAAIIANPRKFRRWYERVAG